MNKIIKALKEPSRIVLRLLKLPIARLIPDKAYLKIKFRALMKKKLDLKNPKSYNEKLQWLKLYDRKPEYTNMVDKCEAKKYVADKIGEEYIIRTLGVWDKFEDIDFSALPDRFVLKCTHDCGGMVFCKDKSMLDYEAAKEKLTKSLKRSYFYGEREWPYKNVRPRIIAEEFIETKTNDLPDYKFMCFNGRIGCVLICSDRFSDEGVHMSFLDRDWNLLPFGRREPRHTSPIPKPQCYDKMVELAEQLAAGIPFSRIDFYEADGRILFGEITFFPGGGFKEFVPNEWDYTLGSWLELPEKK